jgi:hypothetical protein
MQRDLQATPDKIVLVFPYAGVGCEFKIDILVILRSVRPNSRPLRRNCWKIMVDPTANGACPSFGQDLNGAAAKDFEERPHIT